MPWWKRRKTSIAAPMAMPGALTLTDAGMVSNYRPSARMKSGPMGRVIQRVSRAWNRVFHRTDPAKTTEQGAARFASPSTGALSLYQLRYERRDMIADCRQMVIDDPRARKATLMFAREAVRKGCTIIVDKKAARGTTGRRYKIAEECAQRVQKIANKKLFSGAWMLTVEGDLFWQAIVSGDEVVDVKRMPASAMERNSDDTDEIIDPMRAFSQVDVNTNQEVATFPLALMWHGRWNHIDGEAYGEPEIVAGRRLRRLLELSEDASVTALMTRAVKQNLWLIGDKDNPDPDAVDDFKEKNGYNEGTREIYNPNEVATDVFGTGNLDVKTVDGQISGEMKELLRYHQGTYLASLPTFKAIMGVDAEAINRDVLEKQYEAWLKDSATLTDQMAEAVGWLYELDLLLHGVLPETVSYTAHFSESNAETPTERADKVIKLRQATIGAGRNAQPDPLLSKRRALQMLAEDTDVDDVEAEEAQIEEEMRAMGEFVAEQTQMQAKATAAAQGTNKPVDGNDEPAGRNGNGAARNGNSRNGQGNGKQPVGAGK